MCTSKCGETVSRKNTFSFSFLLTEKLARTVRSLYPIRTSELEASPTAATFGRGLRVRDTRTDDTEHCAGEKSGRLGADGRTRLRGPGLLRVSSTWCVVVPDGGNKVRRSGWRRSGHNVACPERSSPWCDQQRLLGGEPPHGPGRVSLQRNAWFATARCDCSVIEQSDC